MKLAYTQNALGTLSHLPLPIRKTFYKQAVFLVANLHHPSLHAKKYSESEDKWQARVNRGGASTSKSSATRTLLLRLFPIPSERVPIWAWSTPASANAAVGWKIWGPALRWRDPRLERRPVRYYVLWREGFYRRGIQVRAVVTRAKGHDHDSSPICVSRYRSALRVSPSSRAAWLLFPSARRSASRIRSCSY